MAIEKIYRRYYASLDVPENVRQVIGRRKFRRSLDTDSLSVAKRREAVLVADWQAQIQEARQGAPVDDAEFYRRALERAGPGNHARVLQEIEVVADNKAGITVDEAVDTPATIRERREIASQEAREFYEVASGQRVHLRDHVEDWLDQAGLTPKVVSNARTMVNDFVDRFRSVEDVTKPQMQAYLNELGQSLAVDTVKKKLSTFRSFWRYLQRHQLAAEDHEPFDRLILPKKKRNGDQKRQAFTQAELVRLVEASRAEARSPLYRIILMAIYTGCRQEELASLRIKDVTLSANGTPVAIHIRGGKTDAAERIIPIHSDLRPVVADLVEESKTGYLLEGEMFVVDKHGRRGSGVSWRFSKFKKKLGFDGRYNFHCIRHSVATMLENSGTPYNVICHIMGWRDKSMLGTYGHGVTLATKREALEKAINFTK